MQEKTGRPRYIKSERIYRGVTSALDDLEDRGGRQVRRRWGRKILPLHQNNHTGGVLSLLDEASHHQMGQAESIRRQSPWSTRATPLDQWEQVRKAVRTHEKQEAKWEIPREKRREART